MRDADEIPHVTRDDVATLRLDRDLQHHIVVRVAQERAPEVKDLSVMRLPAHEVDHRIDVRVG